MDLEIEIGVEVLPEVIRVTEEMGHVIEIIALFGIMLHHRDPVFHHLVQDGRDKIQNQPMVIRLHILHGHHPLGMLLDQTVICHS